MPLLLTHAYFLAEDIKERAIMKPYPPLGILYLASYLEERGIDILVCDTTFSTREEFHRTLIEFRPKSSGSTPT